MTLCAAGNAAAQTASAPESADEVQNRRAAAEAYDNGTARFLRRDFAVAANWYETADRLSPSPLALQNAIRAHREAGRVEHLVRAATLALRLQARHPDDARATQVAQRTLEALGPRFVRVTVRCEECEVEVDTVLQSALDFFVTPGRHTLVAHWSEGRTLERTVDAAAGQRESFALEAPPLPARPVAPEPEPALPPSPVDPTPVTNPLLAPAAPDPSPSTRAGLSPAVFATGAVVTAVLGGITIASWLDATEGGRQLLDAAAQTHMRDLDREQAIHAAEDRTTGLLIATGLVGAASVVTGVFFTRWSGVRQDRVTVVPMADGRDVAGLAVHGRF